MLDTVCTFIQSLDNLSFEEFFQDYIVSIQSININNEIKSLLRNNFLSIDIMMNLISNTCLEMQNDVR